MKGKLIWTSNKRIVSDAESFPFLSARKGFQIIEISQRGDAKQKEHAEITFRDYLGETVLDILGNYFGETDRDILRDDF